ncbi:hypothetical protein ACRRTK_007399 [Alexandromys fortis]
MTIFIRAKTNLSRLKSKSVEVLYHGPSRFMKLLAVTDRKAYRSFLELFAPNEHYKCFLHKT